MLSSLVLSVGTTAPIIPMTDGWALGRGCCHNPSRSGRHWVEKMFTLALTKLSLLPTQPFLLKRYKTSRS